MTSTIGRRPDHTVSPVVERHTLTPAQLQERSIISNSLVPRPEVNAFRDLRTRLQATADGHNFVTLVARGQSPAAAPATCAATSPRRSPSTTPAAR